ncbi:CPBP family intramembrane glutamic endopeptidase [Pseudoclavibacter sp. RFBB5]|uniref:CPBP family intramembrane glutamic endopeptidase n=1 Tax=Pseudoclavibacter sp. RFBB5 TaxID=2080574 RepID=UPI000CE77B39|nr:type II CAAX endopeptidase family protein [Pseudoclavibacter sp. RFBB5]PPG27213.1 hypothetical protein C5B97_17500 [Pseudoclavibacter sp. RFBB5]
MNFTALTRARSDVPGLSYAQALKGSGCRWRGVAAIITGLGIFAFLVFVASAPVAIALDMLLGQAPFDPDDPSITIGLWAGGNLLIAAMIPVAGLLQWAFYGVRPGALSSLLGRFRWGWCAKMAAFFLPFWLLVSVVVNFAAPAGAPVLSGANLMLVGIALVTIPLQSAGEEYLFRGLFFRAVGSFFARRWVAIVSALVLTSVGFAVFHAPSSGWALGYYVVVGVCFAVLTQLTGGLEASSLAHATGNTMLTLPIVLSGNLDNLTVVSGPLLMVPMIAMVLATVVLGWWGRRREMTGRADPAATS